ncbi:TPA: hypothetical protein U1Z95_002262 [Streptococcus suis]|nr:hypothetical protein [Streptococcus suis]HEM4610672.1 hypothetical protein [Streptococcus suis]
MLQNRIFHGNEKPTNAVEGDCWYRDGELLVFKNDWERCVDKENIMSKDVQQFLEFRKKFSKREWHELNRAVEVRLNEKADQLELDDFDLKAITERLERYL